MNASIFGTIKELQGEISAWEAVVVNHLHLAVIEEAERVTVNLVTSKLAIEDHHECCIQILDLESSLINI